MSINLNALIVATRHLPSPKEVGQVISVCTDRIKDLDEQNFTIREEMETSTIQVTHLVAVKYCKHKDNCWLEWEVNV